MRKFTLRRRRKARSFAISCLKWQNIRNAIFQHLPVETMVHDNQIAYYQAINDSTQAADSGIFIDFMTTEILNALKLHKGEAVGTVNGTVNGTLNDISNQILAFIAKNQGVRANVISQELHIPIRTLRRHLKKLSENDITFNGSSKTGGYFIKK